MTFEAPQMPTRDEIIAKIRTRIGKPLPEWNFDEQLANIEKYLGEDSSVLPPYAYQVLIKIIQSDQMRLPDGSLSLLEAPDDIKDFDKYSKVVAQVIAWGPDAYRDEHRFGGCQNYIPYPGDYFIFPRHNGMRFGQEKNALFYLPDTSAYGPTTDPFSVYRD